MRLAGWCLNDFKWIHARTIPKGKAIKLGGIEPIYVWVQLCPLFHPSPLLFNSSVCKASNRFPFGTRTKRWGSVGVETCQALYKKKPKPVRLQFWNREPFLLLVDYQAGKEIHVSSLLPHSHYTKSLVFWQPFPRHMEGICHVHTIPLTTCKHFSDAISMLCYVFVFIFRTVFAIYF